MSEKLEVRTAGVIDGDYVQVYNANATEDIDQIELICETARTRIYQLFNINLKDNRLIAVIFIKTYQAIMEKLIELEKSYEEYDLNIADRLHIGFNTSNDEDDEKQGNFAPYIYDTSNQNKSVTQTDKAASAKEAVCTWSTLNIHDNREVITEIANNAKEKLKALNIALANSEFVFPMFVTIYECLVAYLKIHRKELQDCYDLEINFLNCFSIKAIAQDDIDDAISIRPSIETKLSIKDDGKASAKFE